MMIPLWKEIVVLTGILAVGFFAIWISTKLYSHDHPALTVIFMVLGVIIIGIDAFLSIIAFI